MCVLAFGYPKKFTFIFLTMRKEIIIVGIRRHNKEWVVFDKRVKELSKKDTYSKYLTKRIQSLIEDYNNCSDCILETLSDKKSIRRFYKVPKHLHNDLKEISKKSKIPMTTIIDRLIITPLLIEK